MVMSGSRVPLPHSPFPTLHPRTAAVSVHRLLVAVAPHRTGGHRLHLSLNVCGWRRAVQCGERPRAEGCAGQRLITAPVVGSCSEDMERRRPPAPPPTPLSLMMMLMLALLVTVTGAYKESHVEMLKLNYKRQRDI